MKLSKLAKPAQFGLHTTTHHSMAVCGSISGACKCRAFASTERLATVKSLTRWSRRLRATNVICVRAKTRCPPSVTSIRVEMAPKPRPKKSAMIRPSTVVVFLRRETRTRSLTTAPHSTPLAVTRLSIRTLGRIGGELMNLHGELQDPKGNLARRHGSQVSGRPTSRPASHIPASSSVAKSSIRCGAVWA